MHPRTASATHALFPAARRRFGRMNMSHGHPHILGLLLADLGPVVIDAPWLLWNKQYYYPIQTLEPTSRIVAIVSSLCPACSSLMECIIETVSTYSPYGRSLPNGADEGDEGDGRRVDEAFDFSDGNGNGDDDGDGDVWRRRRARAPPFGPGACGDRTMWL